MHTLALESLADEAPTVSFVNDFPGAVLTPLFDGIPGWYGVATRMWARVLWLFQRWVCVPIEECGERHVFLGTSAKYTPGEGRAVGVGLVGDIEASHATENVRRSVYSVGWDCEGPGEHVMGLLEELRNESVKEIVWRHTNEQFERVRSGKKL